VASQDNDGETPLHLVSDPPRSCSPILLREHPKVARMLLEHGADVNARNKRGLTPFDLASQRGRVGIINVLVQYGASSGAHDNAI
jgi:ankyrin repeat protein